MSVLLVTVRDDEEFQKTDVECFARAGGFAPERFRLFDATTAIPTTALLDGVDAAIIGGSRYSVFEPMPHLAELVALVREAKIRHLPMLGVCFGAQLIAHAFGGEVIRDDAHEEYGTFDMRCAEDAWTDMLFADIPDVFPAQCAHHDRIAKLPPAAMLLASSARCGVQAFVMPGNDIYGFQFHPERSRADFVRVIERKAMDSAGGTALGSVRQSLRETPDAESLIAKFIDRVVLQR